MSVIEETTRDGVERCPTGCDFGELEIGRESESVMAMFGAPHQHIKCGKCGFNGDPATAAECKRFGCGGDRPGAQCCAAAFACCLCGTRIVGTREAPEME